MEVKIGSMPGLSVATLAALRLNATCPAVVVASDLVGPMMVLNEPLAPHLAYTGSSGYLDVPRSPGLGQVKSASL